MQYQNFSLIYLLKLSTVEKIVLTEKFSKITVHWHPYIVGELNDNFIKVAKVKDDFVWHKHEREEELFMVQKGTLFIDFRNKTVEVKQGEILTVPKGVEHRPRTNGEEVLLLLIEPKKTKHTGDLVTERTVERLEWI